VETNRKNTAIMFMLAGAYLLLGELVGYAPVSAVILIWLGVHRIKYGGDRKGYLVLGAGALLLLGDQLIVLMAVVLIFLGAFFIKSHMVHKDGRRVERHAIADSIRHDSGPWTPENTSRFSLFSELRLDLSLAMQEEEEVVYMLQGLVGDVDVIVPPAYGLALESNLLVGRVTIGDEKEGGFLNRRAWRSPNYDQCPHKMKLIVDCIVGDIEIRMV